MGDNHWSGGSQKGTPNKSRALACLSAVIVLLQASPALAMLMPIDPLENVRSVGIEIIVGDQIDANSESSQRLFHDDHARWQRFQNELREAMAKRLKKSGLEETPDSTATVVVGIWGHSIPAGDCGLDFVFLISFGVSTEDLPDASSREVIGTASDKRLEHVLIDAVIKLLDDALHRVDYAAEHPQRRPADYPALEGVTITFDHFGASTDPLDQRMAEDGKPVASNLPGNDYWLCLQNGSAHTIQFDTFSTYVLQSPPPLFTLDNGSSVLALEDGMEVSLAFRIQDAHGEPVRYTAVDMFWQSFLPPGRSVLFGVHRELLSEGRALSVEFTDADQSDSPVYRAHFNPGYQ